MSKVYLYSRVSTNQQTLEQQERTVYEWLKLHDMHVDEVVSDCGISGGVSYADRALGKVLLPKMNAGDMLIVSEISRLGRSMFDLSKLIHTELKPRKLRLVVCNMSIDLRCDKLTAIDELILNNFSFAAQLEKQLISERTLSALEVKRKQGVKLGGASDKYKLAISQKSEEEITTEYEQRGNTKRTRHKNSRDVQAFLKVLRNVFPEATKNDNPYHWYWGQISTKGNNKTRILSLMRDYSEIDRDLFKSWDFSNVRKSQTKLRSYIQSTYKSIKN